MSVSDGSLPIDKFLRVLGEACYSSCSSVQRRIADETAQFETYPTFVPALWSCVTNQLGKSTCARMRLMAGIMLKTHVKRALSGEVEVSDEAWDAIKRGVVSHIELENHCLESQLSAITTMIVEHQGLQKWPELMTELVKHIQNKDEPWKSVLASHRLLEVLKVVQTNSCRCSVHGVFVEVCTRLFHVVMKEWLDCMRVIKPMLEQCPVLLAAASLDKSVYHAPAELLGVFSFARAEEMERVLFCGLLHSQILKILLEAAFETLVERSKCFLSFWKTYVAVIEPLSLYIRRARWPYQQLFVRPDTQSLLGTMTFVDGNSRPMDWIYFTLDEEREGEGFSKQWLYCPAGGFYAVTALVQAVVKSLTCVPVIVNRKFPDSMQLFVLPLLQFYYKHLLAELPLPRDPESADEARLAQSVLSLGRLASAAIALLGNVATRLRELPQTPESLAAHADVRGFFSADVVEQLLQLLCSSVLSWEARELAEWAQEPEAFFCAQLIEREGQCSLRSAGERLLLGLLAVAPRQVTDMLHRHLLDLDTQARICSLPACADSELLYWDGVYHAAGLCVDRLAEQQGFDCTAWLQSVMGAMLARLGAEPRAAVHSSALQPVLRVRMLRLLGAWMDAFSTAVLPHVAQFLAAMLTHVSLGARKSSEVVVHLYTARAVESLLRAKRCALGTVAPQLQGLAAQLCTLAAAIDDFEVRRWLLSITADLAHLAQGSDPAVLDLRPVLGAALSLWAHCVAPLDEALARCLVADASLEAVYKFRCDNSGILVPALLELLRQVVEAMSTQSPSALLPSTRRADESALGGLEALLLGAVLTAGRAEEVQADRAALFMRLLRSAAVSRCPEGCVAVLRRLWSDCDCGGAAGVQAQLVHCAELCCLLFPQRVALEAALCHVVAPRLVPGSAQSGSVSWLDPRAPSEVRLAALRLLQNLSVSLPCEALQCLLLYEAGRDECSAQSALVARLLQLCFAAAPCGNLASVHAQFRGVDCEQLSAALDCVAVLLLRVPAVALGALSLVRDAVLQAVERALPAAAGSAPPLLSEETLLDQLLRLWLEHADSLWQQQSRAYFLRLRLWLQALSSLLALHGDAAQGGAGRALQCCAAPRWVSASRVAQWRGLLRAATERHCLLLCATLRQTDESQRCLFVAQQLSELVSAPAAAQNALDWTLLSLPPADPAHMSLHQQHGQQQPWLELEALLAPAFALVEQCDEPVVVEEQTDCQGLCHRFCEEPVRALFRAQVAHCFAVPYWSDGLA